MRELLTIGGNIENEYDEVDNSEGEEVNEYEEKEVDKIDDGYELEDYMDAGDLDAYKYEISNRSADEKPVRFLR